MTKSRLASFLDSCLASASCMFIMLIIFAKFGFSLLLRLILASILSAVVFIVFYLREKKRYTNQKLKVKDQKHFELVCLTLDLMTTAEKKEFFKTLFKKQELSLSSDKNPNPKVLYNAVSFYHDESTQNRIQQTIDETKTKNFDIYYLLTNGTSPKSTLIEKHKALLNKNIIELSPEELYSLMKKHNYFPDITAVEPVSLTFKTKTKMFFQNLLYKRNAKGFFFAGLMIFITSLYLPYFKSYYTIISFILFSISAICIIFGKKIEHTKMS